MRWDRARGGIDFYRVPAVSSDLILGPDMKFHANLRTQEDIVMTRNLRDQANLLADRLAFS
jgi:hypothetical protein